jgi:WD40 repeat protein
MEGLTCFDCVDFFIVQLLSVSSDGLMKLWTMRSQECEATFDEHNDRVWALALSPDGKEVRWLIDWDDMR